MRQDYGRRYRDPIHGYVYVPHELVSLVDSAFISRLRRIHQNGCGHIAYPSLTGSRFEHALGVMHLAMKAWSSAWNGAGFETQSALALDVYKDLQTKGADPYFAELQRRRSGDDRERLWLNSFGDVMGVALGAAALLHDVGHPPYSHTLEPEFSKFRSRIFDEGTLTQLARIEAEAPGMQFHEVCGQILSERALAPLQETFCTWITVQILSGDTAGAAQWARAIHRIIAGPIDMDRLDYILRDASRAGTEFGAIDVERIIESISIERGSEAEARWGIGFGARAISAIETLLTNRERAYRWVYFHANSLAADTALRRLVHEAFERDDEPLSQFDYLTKWDECDAYAGSAWVDDARIIAYLNSALHRMPHTDVAADRMRALHRLAIDGDRDAVFAWRSYEELLGAFQTMPLEWRQNLLQRAQMADDAVTGGSGAARTWRANEDRYAAALNSIAQLRLDDDGDLEYTIESLLNERHRKVSSTPGTWIVAQRLRFSMQTAKIELWHGAKKMSVKRLSPIVSGLEEAEAKRLKIWACFVPFARTNYEREDRAHRGTETAQIFLSEFVGPTASATENTEGFSS